MPAPRFLLVACSLVLCVLTQTAPPARAGQADGGAGGQIQSSLTLNGRRVSVTYDPALPSDHRSLLVLRAGSTQAAVRLGRLEGHRSLAIGTLAPDPDEPRGPRPGPRSLADAHRRGLGAGRPAGRGARGSVRRRRRRRPARGIHRPAWGRSRTRQRRTRSRECRGRRRGGRRRYSRRRRGGQHRRGRRRRGRQWIGCRRGGCRPR